MKAAARIRGLIINRAPYLGFRAKALHPRLYADARIRGLGLRAFRIEGLTASRVCADARIGGLGLRAFRIKGLTASRVYADARIRGLGLRPRLNHYQKKSRVVTIAIALHNAAI